MTSCKIDGNSGVSVRYARSVQDLESIYNIGMQLVNIQHGLPHTWIIRVHILLYSTLLYEGWLKGWLKGLADSVDVGSSANGPQGICQGVRVSRVHDESQRTS